MVEVDRSRGTYETKRWLSYLWSIKGDSLRVCKFLGLCNNYIISLSPLGEQVVTLLHLPIIPYPMLLVFVTWSTYIYLHTSWIFVTHFSFFILLHVSCYDTYIKCIHMYTFTWVRIHFITIHVKSSCIHMGSCIWFVLSQYRDPVFLYSYFLLSLFNSCLWLRRECSLLLDFYYDTFELRNKDSPSLIYGLLIFVFQWKMKRKGSWI